MNKLILIFILSFVFLYAQENSNQKVISHALGKTTIKGKPLRVVSLYNGATESILALGVKPIGVSESWIEKPIYKFLRPHLKDVKLLGLESQPSIEEIALLKPDLIIATKHRHEKIYKTLSKIAPTIVTERLYDFKYSLNIVSKALGKEELANKILEDYNTRVLKIKKSIKNKCLKNPIEVSIININSSYIRLFLGGSYTGGILTDLDFKVNNTLEYQGQHTLKLTSKENLDVVDADIFFTIKQSNKKVVLKEYEKLRAYPLFKALKAVRNNQVFDVNPITWLFSCGILGANYVLDDIEEQISSKINCR